MPLPNEMPIMNMTLKGMQHSIQMALNSHLDEIKEMAADQIEAAVRNFDYAGEVQRALQPVLQECVQEIAEDLARKVSESPELKTAIRRAFQETLTNGASDVE